MVFLQAGKEIAQRNAELQYNEANPAPVTRLTEHLADFDKAWTGMQRKWLSERAKYDSLTTANEREAFKIMRNWSQTDSPDFKIHCRSLARRLGISWPGASKLRRRFCALGILHKTAEYVAHKLAARYQWTANDQ